MNKSNIIWKAHITMQDNAKKKDNLVIILYYRVKTYVN